MNKIIYTLGHSDRNFKEFIDILSKYSIEVVIDIRRWPSSKRFPHFNRGFMMDGLGQIGIDYIWLGDVLGGYRRIGVDSSMRIIPCFQSEGFNAYALYILESDEASKALERVEEVASDNVAVLICSERYPFRCHRKILADYFTVRGFKTIHLIDLDKTYLHRLSNCAFGFRGRLSYIEI